VLALGASGYRQGLLDAYTERLVAWMIPKVAIETDSTIIGVEVLFRNIDTQKERNPSTPGHCQAHSSRCARASMGLALPLAPVKGCAFGLKQSESQLGGFQFEERSLGNDIRVQAGSGIGNVCVLPWDRNCSWRVDKDRRYGTHPSGIST
jgi:hypothetical protein